MEVVLKNDAIVFGVQLQNGSRVYIEPVIGSESIVIHETQDENGRLIRQKIDLLEMAPEDFLNECKDVNFL